MSKLQLLLVEGERGNEEDVSCQLDEGNASDWVINVDASKGTLFVSNRYGCVYAYCLWLLWGADKCVSVCLCVTT